MTKRTCRILGFVTTVVFLFCLQPSKAFGQAIETSAVPTMPLVPNLCLASGAVVAVHTLPPETAKRLESLTREMLPLLIKTQQYIQAIDVIGQDILICKVG